jgi:hydrogenase expression/formation protein HypE
MHPQMIFPTGKLPLEFLNSLLQSYSTQDARLICGPRVGEDVAVIDMGDRYIVVKTDPITFATDQIGWYAVNVNANDVATSGARPLWMLNTVLLPQYHTTPEMVTSIFGQLHDACAQLGITLVGGHTEVTWGLDRPMVVGVLIGEVAHDRLITTGGARVGDRVILVKGIPIEATAIIAREKADELARRGYSADFLSRAQSFLFDPGISVVAAARLAADHPGVHAMHDPTEGGLATGLHELAFASQTGLRLDYDHVVMLDEGLKLCTEYGLDPLGAIASGALIVAVHSAQSGPLLHSYHAAHIRATDIGELLPPADGIYMIRGGQREELRRFDSDEIARIF